jgi:hypothetical protein
MLGTRGERGGERERDYMEFEMKLLEGGREGRRVKLTRIFRV